MTRDRLNVQKRNQELKIEQLKKAKDLQEVQSVLQHLREDLKANEEERRNKLNDLEKIKNEQEGAEKQIQTEQYLLLMSKKKLRNLAILIVTEWESAKLLRQFADLVVNPEELSNQRNEPSNSAKESCQQFIKMFDEHKQILISQIKAQYGYEVQ
jgi:hypothetical protein